MCGDRISSGVVEVMESGLLIIMSQEEKGSLITWESMT